jgi:hypothetical protein
MSGYRVQFAKPFPGGSEVHRIRNWTEDIARALKDPLIGEVPDMDTATDSVTVRVFKPSNLGDTLRAIRHTLRHANLEPHATIVRF